MKYLTLLLAGLATSALAAPVAQERRTNDVESKLAGAGNAINNALQHFAAARKNDPNFKKETDNSALDLLNVGSKLLKAGKAAAENDRDAA
ncbi:hypothetical protein NLG97_g10217 [Lecanicillium saksenae]|uniref:Uncharacterized protein n=1 Tax=Lecanicillium saksenae TaxID=468837 RepID=A0ACC1QDU5_9HYPO|nr:hypothetical protein NLG97_g10217 [Lecanicillium saksenae]